MLVRRVNAAGAAGPVAKGGRMALGYSKLFHNGWETFIAWGTTKHIETTSLAKIETHSDSIRKNRGTPNS